MAKQLGTTSAGKRSGVICVSKWFFVLTNRMSGGILQSNELP
jgi:hypothetical protein